MRMLSSSSTSPRTQGNATATCASNGAWRRGSRWSAARDQCVESTRYFDLEVDYLNNHGMTARFFEPEDLHEAWDCPPQLRYGLGVRNFTIPDWLDNGIDTAPVQAALDHGCLLVGTQTSTFLSSKLTMGLVSEGQPYELGRAGAGGEVPAGDAGAGAPPQHVPAGR
jgi:hypothetical protein